MSNASNLNYLDPDTDMCQERGCTCPAYKKGYCYTHYEEHEADYADHLYDMRRDEELERKSNERR